MSTDPSRTRALVVGVESYGGEPGWQLDGPVNDALTWARWLLTAGVPPDRVTLLLSPLERNTRHAERAPVAHRPADRETVHQALFRELPAAGGDLLFVAWCGHGLVSSDRRHRLLYADAAPDDVRALDLDAALTAYRSALVPGFPEQVWLADACAVDADPGALRPDPVPAGRATPRPGQCAAFACAPDGSPRNGVVTRQGALTAQALSLLTWPPDTDRLLTALGERLSPGAPGDPRPRGYFWRHGPSRPAPPVATVPPPPQPGPPPRRSPRPGLNQRRRLLEALEAVPAVAEPASREVVLQQLPRSIRGSLPRSNVTRLDLLGLLDTCLAFPDGLVHLWTAIGMVDPGTSAFRALREVLGEFPSFAPEQVDDLE
ncbi:hypothetical protein AQ490_08180 [Wenjunlia vitaminophila]|uniref:Effector-associated domain-containing protein n=1 Tax=Wenjunlia vitaminophila TaxID=76728 RepID=A0A0T6LMW4_WENVI|nr:caspase family protein [Wenjunlia vitaminophila]KRV47422.1 hypothetical protein AQ490_08180 [Wenjunlia vitaminophila]